jgi:hypothetical protein
MGVFDWIGALGNMAGKGLNQAADAAPLFLGGRGDTGFLGGGTASAGTSKDSYSRPVARPFPTTAQSRGDTYGPDPPSQIRMTAASEPRRPERWQTDAQKQIVELHAGRRDSYPVLEHHAWNDYMDRQAMERQKERGL